MPACKATEVTAKLQRVRVVLQRGVAVARATQGRPFFGEQAAACRPPGIAHAGSPTLAPKP